MNKSLAFFGAVAVCVVNLVAVLVPARADNVICGFQKNTGQVARIYPQFSPGLDPNGGTFFRLKNGQTAALANANSYYFIPAGGSSSHLAVYQTLNNLLLEAAKSGKTVSVRISASSPVCSTGTPATTAAIVEYLTVDY
jgi:hypothetical protein